MTKLFTNTYSFGRCSDKSVSGAGTCVIDSIASGITYIHRVPACLCLLIITLFSWVASAQCQSGIVRVLGPRVNEEFPRTVISPNITYDPVDGRIVLVGQSSDEDRIETWVWTGFEWRRQFTSDGIEPPGVISFALAYHEGSGRVLMFGGRTSSGSLLSQTWVWDGYYWSMPTYNDSPPPASDQAACVYVPVGDQVILAGNPDASLWSWATTSDGRPGGWLQLSPSGVAPPARAGTGGLCWDASAQILYYVDPNNISGQWGWSPLPAPHGRWINISNDPAPGLPGVPAMLTFDSREGKLLRIVHQDSGARRYVHTGGGMWTDDGYAGDALNNVIFDLRAAHDSRLKKTVIIGREFPHDDLRLFEFDSGPDSALPIAGEPYFDGLGTYVMAMSRGQEPLEYQWFYGGVAIEDNTIFEGSRSRTLATAPLRGGCYDGLFTFVVTNQCGSVVSPGAIMPRLSIADFNIDGGVDGSDVQSFFEAFAPSLPVADVNCDGGIDGADIETFFVCWMLNCE